jgi:membrane protease YdiL (CAAX protease family)
LITSSGAQFFLLLALLKGPRQRCREGSEFPKEAWSVFDVVLACFLFNVIVWISVIMAGRFPEVETYLAYNYYFPYVVFMALVMVLCKARHRRLASLGFRDNTFADASFMLVIGSSIFLTAIVSVVLARGSPSDLLRVIQFLFGISVTGVFAEECLIRGIMYRSFRQRYGAPTGIVLASLFFAVMHPAGLSLFQGSVHFAAGVIFGVIYERTESIILTSAAHGVYNMCYFILA